MSWILERLLFPLNIYLTQSLWRDEAFSVLMAGKPLPELFRLVAADFNPPLYYLLLHFWMAAFGQSEIAIRLLSFIFHLGTSFFGYKIGRHLWGKNVGTWVALLVFINPILLYYGFEARMYSLYPALVAASFYFFLTRQWRFHALASVLAVYSHLFSWFALVAQGLFLAGQSLVETSRKPSRKKFLTAFKKHFPKETIASYGVIFTLYLPWLPVLLTQLTRAGGGLWIYPLNWNQVNSSLGDLYTGYEGTPGGLWDEMKWLSLLILSLGGLALAAKKTRQMASLFLLWLFVPLISVFILSVVRQPLYVNRYLVFLAIPEVLLITSAIVAISKKRLITTFFLLAFLATLAFSLWYAPYHRKVNFRATFSQIKENFQSGDLVVSASPLSFHEANYYFSPRSAVFLYNPEGNPVPSYVGANLMPPERWLSQFPLEKRVWLVADDGSFTLIAPE